MCPDAPHPSAQDSALMVLETPLLRVSRPVAACSRCRSAKVKCDGKLPACTACEKANRAQECSSTNDQFARGKERSYVATLEARVEKLEKRLQEARSRRQSSVTMTEPDVQPAPRPPPAPTQSKAKDKAARRKEEADINDLVSDFGLLSVNATARDFYGFTSAMSYARLILSASSKEPLPSGMAKSLPARYAINPLIQHYLNTMFVLLPILDETSFYGSVDAVYQSDPRKTSPFDFWTLRMVLAISSITNSEQRGDVHYSDAVGHVNAALEHAEHVLRPGSVASIQALLLLAQYSMLDPHHFDSWTLVGAASRAMVDLGMHVDPSKSVTMSKAKLEIRRRVYYCLYSIDR
ncbi:Zn 2cys6 cluster transcripitional activator [Neofusicoccum parvum]|nr:Zn 2cys6 cluster transcripitional activator [Neofusicoccum parvum]